MSDQGFSPSWHAAFRALGIDTAKRGTPGGDTGEWVEAVMKFAKKGFVLVFIKDAIEPHIPIRVDVALPDPEHTHRFSRELSRRFDVMGGHDARVVETGPPDVVRVKFAKDTEEEDLVVLLTLLLKVGDYIFALKSDPNTPSPLEHMGDTDHDNSSAPEPGGATVFEAIGRAPAEEPEEQAPSDGELLLREFAIQDIGSALDVTLGLSRALSRREQQAISAGFQHAFRTRMDTDARSVDTQGVADFEVSTSPDATLVFALTPAGSDRSREATRQLAEDTERYLKRVVQFGELGMSLFGTLNVSPPGGPTSHTSWSEDKRSTRKDLPSLRTPSPPAAPAPSTDTSEEEGVVVLGFGAASPPVAPSGESLPKPHKGALQRGHYGDPRLKRPDATTALVDVVLRHPGYSDKRIAQVLSILLSVEYTDAKRTAEDAPCVIAWGIGRERAQTFRSVIEGAGGKALLVEPGTFGS